MSLKTELEDIKFLFKELGFSSVFWFIVWVLILILYLLEIEVPHLFMLSIIPVYIAISLVNKKKK